MMFEGFILAGGRSTRMDREKAVIELNGKSFLEIAADTVEKSGASQVTVVAGSKAKMLESHVGDLYLKDDFSPGLGAAGGILTAIELSKEDSVFVLACDMPFVSKELIELLREKFEESGAAAAVPIQPDGYKQPLCAFYRKSLCTVPFKGLIGRSEYAPSVRDLIGTVKTVFVDYEEISRLDGSGNFFLNINTPLDLDSARRIARAK